MKQLLNSLLAKCHKSLFTIAFLSVATISYAQSWAVGSGNKLYVNPGGTYVGIGVTNPMYKLDVNGKLFLRTYEWIDATAYSYLNWQTHALVMGTPKGEYSVTKLYLKPGGHNGDSLYSEIKMFTAYGENNHVARIRFCTQDNCYFNNHGFVGIGTTTPKDKLDVRGTIRAFEIIVEKINGADFVFDKSYNLRPLNEVKDFVEKNKHLPDIPSAAEMQESGVNMNELQIQLLQKVEELTLYIIQQDQRIQELESQITK